MAVTLANVRAGMQDALSAQVIDEFCKSSYLLDNMISVSYTHLTLPTKA